MRLRRLTLDRFGQFTGKSYDFGPGRRPSDFHVIYGPNEAGKTTTMEAYLRLLYGFHTREPYDFQHQRKNLQVSGVLESGDTEHSFTRLPLRSGALTDANGNALPETAIAQFLGGLDETDYRQLLCLDDDTIEKGGEEIVNSQGDIGRLLFSAAAGVADLSGVLDQTREQADRIYRKRGTKTEIAQKKRELASVEASIREHDVSASAYRKLRQTFEQAKHEETEARAKLNALQESISQTSALRTTLPLMHELTQLDTDIAPFAHYPDHLDINPEDLVRLLTQQSKTQADLDRLTAEIDILQSDLNAIELDETHLPLAEHLADLAPLKSRFDNAEEDLPRRRKELDLIHHEMAQRVHDLNLPPDTKPQNLVLPLPVLQQLEAIRDQRRELDVTKQRTVSELAELTEKQALAKQKLRDLLDRTSGISVADCLDRFSVTTLATDEAALRQAMTDARSQLRQRLSELTIDDTDFSTVPPCPVTVDQARSLAEQLDDVQHRITQTLSNIQDHEEEQSVLQAQIAQISELHDLQDAQIAADIKIQRDHLWEQHLSSMTQETARAFSKKMTLLDTVFEKNLAQANELGQLRQMRMSLAETTARYRHDHAKHAALLREKGDLSKTVDKIISVSGLPASTDPRVVLSWVARRAAAQDAQTRFDEIIAQNSDKLNKINLLTKKLTDMLGLHDPDFTDLLTVAHPIATQERGILASISELETQIINRQTQLAEHEKNSINHLKDNDIFEQLGLGGFVDVHQLDLPLLHHLRELDARRTQVAHQVDAMTADQSEFAVEIQTLASDFNLDEGTPSDVFRSLAALSKRATDTQTRAGNLAERLNTCRAQRKEVLAELKSIEDQTKVLAAVFDDSIATDTLEDLRISVQEARTVIEKRERARALETQIGANLHTSNLTEAKDMLQRRSSAELDAIAVNLDRDRMEAEQALTEAISARAQAQTRLKSVSGDDEIAQLVEQKATLELEIQELVFTHLKLSFGYRMAKEAIRRYRDSHRGQMMVATETAFRDLTNGAYQHLRTQSDGSTERLLAIDVSGVSKRAQDMSKGTRFQLYLALRAAAYQQILTQGTTLPFFCDDVFETFDESRTRAACQIMRNIGSVGQAIYLTHHQHVVDIAQQVCGEDVTVHQVS